MSCDLALFQLNLVCIQKTHLSYVDGCYTIYFRITLVPLLMVYIYTPVTRGFSISINYSVIHQ